MNEQARAARQQEAADIRLVACPKCDAPAEIEWSTRMGSTSGTVEHVKIRCLHRHWFLMTSDSLTS